jgi:hypothetical protein
MRKSNHHAIRMVLQKYPDGLTLTEIIERIEKDRSAVTRALKEMPDAYIDRWMPYKGSGPSPWQPVWCVIVAPENCPKPTEKPNETNKRRAKLRGMEQREPS